jgi:hypothetical protein
MLDASRLPTRRLRLFLRDFRQVDAITRVAEGQSLTSYCANRRSYINLQEARWTTGDAADFVVLRVSQLLWAASLDGDVPLVQPVPSAPGRLVEMHLDGGLFVRATLMTGPLQRLGDYLESAGQFIPLQHALLLRTGRPPRSVNVVLGDIALNQDAIQAMWEFRGNDDAEAAVDDRFARDPRDVADEGLGLQA